MFFLQRLSESNMPTTNQVRDPSGQSHPNMGGDRQPYCHIACRMVTGRQSGTNNTKGVADTCPYHVVSATTLRRVKAIPDTAPRGQHADRRSGWTPKGREDLDDLCHDTCNRDHRCDVGHVIPHKHSSSPSPWSKTHSQTTTFCPPCTRCTASLRERSSDWLRYQVRK